MKERLRTWYQDIYRRLHTAGFEIDFSTQDLSDWSNIQAALKDSQGNFLRIGNLTARSSGLIDFIVLDGQTSEPISTEQCRCEQQADFEGLLERFMKLLVTRKHDLG